MLESKQIDPSVMVALRKESVDRNTDPINLSDIPAKSLSARRAWIEILLRRVLPFFAVGRSPQGERG